ncbi:HAH_0734 family protein [Natronobiforma cellulositropha]|uniref:HAH_0734 family protein n=1 Tax=Natronobiforma cellulositropha TaxID=1679076 RepID=UPI0021D5E047|nr:HAH_0734 family protein [Natronobiforma cellulositropha]
MRRLIINGDPGIRKDAVIEYEGEELTCFGISRNGEWHGPERVQLWCTVGDESEREDYDFRNFVPHFLEVDHADAEEITVIQAKGPLAI